MSGQRGKGGGYGRETVAKRLREGARDEFIVVFERNRDVPPDVLGMVANVCANGGIDTERRPCGAVGGLCRGEVGLYVIGREVDAEALRRRVAPELTMDFELEGSSVMEDVEVALAKVVVEIINSFNRTFPKTEREIALETNLLRGDGCSFPEVGTPAVFRPRHSKSAVAKVL